MSEPNWLDNLSAEELDALRHAGVAEEEIIAIAKASHALSRITFEPYDPSVEHRRTLLPLDLVDR